MFNEIKNICNNTIIYGLGSVATSAINFLLLPVYTRLLTKADYGLLDILTSFTYILGLLLNSGVSTALFKVYFSDCKNDNDRRCSIQTALSFLLIIGGISYCFVLIYSREISWLLFNNKLYFMEIIIVCGTMVLNLLLSVPLAVYRALNFSVKYVKITVSRLLLTIVLNILFVVYYRFGIIGVLYAGLISTIVINIVTTIPLIYEYGLGFNRKLFKQIIYFGIPYIPAGLALWTINTSNRFFINSFMGLSETGLFGLSNRLAGIISIVIVSPFQIAWPPALFRFSDKEGAPILYGKIFSLYLTVALFICLGISLFCYDIIKIIAAPEYLEAYKWVPLLAIGYVLYGLHIMFLTGLWIKNHIKTYPVAVIIAALFSLVGNYYLIKHFGGWGASITLLVSYGIMSGILYVMGQRVYKIPYFCYKTCCSTGFFIILMSLGYMIPLQLPIILSILIRSFIYLLFPISLWSFGFFTTQEKNSIKILFNQWLCFI